MAWIDMTRVAVAPTLDAETLRSRGREIHALEDNKQADAQAPARSPSFGRAGLQGDDLRSGAAREAEGGARKRLGLIVAVPPG
jgi:hypothetical protein